MSANDLNTTDSELGISLQPTVDTNEIDDVEDVTTLAAGDDEDTNAGGEVDTSSAAADDESSVVAEADATAEASAPVEERSDASGDEETTSAAVDDDLIVLVGSDAIISAGDDIDDASGASDETDASVTVSDDDLTARAGADVLVSAPDENDAETSAATGEEETPSTVTDDSTTVTVAGSGAALTVETDESDYAPGDTAIITATDVTVGGTVEFQVSHLSAGEDGIFLTSDDVVDEQMTASGSGHESWLVTDGVAPDDLDGEANGTIVTSWYVSPDDSAGATFLLSASDLTSGETATAFFTDSAPTLDLTSIPASGNIDGVIFSTSVLDVSGTGVIHSFVRIQALGNETSEQGYNTNFRNETSPKTQFDENSSPEFTRSLLLSDVPIVLKDGTAYREFRLDINEPNVDNKQYLSLDSLKIYLGSAPNLNGYGVVTGSPDFEANSVLVWDMDANGDNWIKLDGDLSSGSGHADLSVLVPNSLFSGDNDYVYLYSQFGENIAADSGFEEWYVNRFNNSLSGHKFEDVNGNGAWDDGESGLEGWKIYIDANNDNEFDEGEPFVLTDSDGYYEFTNLSPDTYVVREVLQSGWIQTSPGEPDDGEHQVELGVATHVTDQDFGNFELFNISGYKWNDLNGNGEWDEGEPGLAGWTIYLDTDGDGVGDTSVETSDGSVDANGDGDANTMDVGYYQFTNLGPGEYSVYEASVPNWANTYDGSVTFTAQSGVDHVGRFEVTEALNFGNSQFDGPGVRTPGFWSSPNGRAFWDGIGENESKAGQTGFADGELTYAVDSTGDGTLDAVKGFLVGDYDHNGIRNGDEDVFFISLSDAQKIINASQKELQDVRWVLARDAIATWLNELAGNPLGDAEHCLDETIDWLQWTSGDGDTLFGDWGGGQALKASSTAWGLGINTNGVPGYEIGAGNTIHTALDEYNNDGTINGIQCAADGDLSNLFVT